MQTITEVFLLNLLLTVLVSVGVVFYLKAHLKSLVIELCGSETRANFWICVSNIVLILVPLVVALSVEPELDPSKPAVFVLAEGWRASLAGLVGSVILLSFLLLAFVRRHIPAPVVRPIER
jgi:hypothetical protein